MIYNTGDFVGIPWEVLVKVFRESVGKKVFQNVKECEAAFFNFLDRTILPASSESDMTMLFVMLDAIENLAPNPKAKSLKDVQAHIEKVIEEDEKYIADISKLRDVIPFDIFLAKFKADIAVLCKDAFGFRLTKPYFEKVQRHVYDIVSRTMSSAFMSGVVFAGYGKDQLLPYVSHYVVDGRMKYNIGKEEKRQTRFWLENRFDLSEKDSPNAYVIPFAQSDIFYLFMEGIARSNIYFLNKLLSDVLSEKTDSLMKMFVPDGEKKVERELQEAENETIVKNFFEKFSKYRADKLVDPVLAVIRALPKEEMAAMAEALVEITALRRKVGSTLESVGGPTDVAVISKGEGLVWLKRKHYFEPVLNGDFARRKEFRLEDANVEANGDRTGEGVSA